MRRLSILVASVIASAVITTTPALAAEAAPTAPVAAPVAAVATATPGALPANWFSDWSVCIWGSGVPIGLAWEFKPSWTVINQLSRDPRARGYVSRVVAACGRFIRS